MRALVATAAVLLVALVVAAGVGVATPGDAGERPGQSVRTTLAGQNVRLAIPTGGRPKGLAIWFHGQGGGVNAHFADPFLISLYRDGWAVATSDFHGPSWGNPASTADTQLLIDWAERRAGVPATLWVAGSMGGTVSLNALDHGVTSPHCWYGVHPALSLGDMDRVPHAPDYIRAAYDGAPPRDRNPVHNVDRLPDTVRYRVVGSHEDVWVDFAANIVPLVRGLRTRGVEVSTHVATGNHQDPSHFNTADLLRFASRCAA